jgi:hypothetical protein
LIDLPPVCPIAQHVASDVVEGANFVQDRQVVLSFSFQIHSLQALGQY